MSLDSLLTTRINVERKSPVKDISGGQKEQFAPVANLQNIPATIQARHGMATQDQSQRQVIITHVIYVRDTTGIFRGDIIHHPDTNKRFLVHGLGDMADRHTVGRIECKEIS